jgi:hypothetical protein
MKLPLGRPCPWARQQTWRATVFEEAHGGPPFFRRDRTLRNQSTDDDALGTLSSEALALSLRARRLSSVLRGVRSLADPSAATLAEEAQNLSDAFQLHHNNIMYAMKLRAARFDR